MPISNPPILTLPVELQTEILSYLPPLDQLHCMDASPFWCTLLQTSPALTKSRYNPEIYPTIHRLFFEGHVKCTLQVFRHRIQTIEIFNQPQSATYRPEYTLAFIDLEEEKVPSVLDDLVFLDPFDNYTSGISRPTDVTLIELYLYIYSIGLYIPTEGKCMWRKRWEMSERGRELGLEGITIGGFLRFIVDVIVKEKGLREESYVYVRFDISGDYERTRMLEVVVEVSEQGEVWKGMGSFKYLSGLHWHSVDREVGSIMAGDWFAGGKSREGWDCNLITLSDIQP